MTRTLAPRGATIEPFYAGEIGLLAMARLRAGLPVIAMHFGQPSAGIPTRARAAAHASLDRHSSGYWLSAALKERIARHYARGARRRRRARARAADGRRERRPDRGVRRPVRGGRPHRRRAARLSGLPQRAEGARPHAGRDRLRRRRELSPAAVDARRARRAAARPHRRQPGEPDRGDALARRARRTDRALPRGRHARDLRRDLPRRQLRHRSDDGTRARPGRDRPQQLLEVFRMPGWRLGWIVAPAACVRARRLPHNLFLAPPSLSQHAALAASTTWTLRHRRAVRQEPRAPARRAAAHRPARHRPTRRRVLLYADVGHLTDDSLGLCRRLSRTRRRDRAGNRLRSGPRTSPRAPLVRDRRRRGRAGLGAARAVAGAPAASRG